MNSKRKIGKLNTYSRYVTIPKEYLSELGIKDNQFVEITLDKKNKRIIIKDSQ